MFWGWDVAAVIEGLVTRLSSFSDISVTAVAFRNGGTVPRTLSGLLG